MLRRSLAVFVAVALLPSPAFASTILESAMRALATEAAQTSAPRPPNPYKTPAIVLLAGGAGLMVLGLAQDRGVEVRTTGPNARISETGGSKTTLTVLGTAVMAGGGFLWWRGEQKRGRPSLMPSVTVTPKGAMFQSSLQF